MATEFLEHRSFQIYEYWHLTDLEWWKASKQIGQYSFCVYHRRGFFQDLLAPQDSDLEMW